MTPGEPNSDMSERQAHAEATYERLFGPRDSSAADNDPELMEILRRFIFGDVFDTGVLDDQARELITVTVLACLQALPQLKSHTAAALHVGVQPIQIREAVYQLAPFVGFPRTLNAVATINEVFRDQGIELPLPAQGTVSDADRYSKGLTEQAPLYGNEIKDNLADLPEPFNEALPRFLTEFCFGDFYTRGGLSLAERELLVLCALATIGDTSAQLSPHGRACLQVGNSKTAVVAALVHCFPYIGFPRAVAAIRAVKNLESPQTGGHGFESRWLALVGLHFAMPVRWPSASTATVTPHSVGLGTTPCLTCLIEAELNRHERQEDRLA
jgi:4-carboxymuconolactone decarboxylase